MELVKAIEQTITLEGKEIICDMKFANYLSDFCAYKKPAIKRILICMIKGDYTKKLLSINSNEICTLFQNDIVTRLVASEGFNEEYVRYLLDNLMVGLGLINKPQTIDKVPTVDIPSQPNNPTDKAFDGKMEVKNTNGYYFVSFNHATYKLDKKQYNAIMRKKNIPADKLELWLKSYSKKNNDL